MSMKEQMKNREESMKTGYVRAEFDRREDGIDLNVSTSATSQEIIYIVKDLLEQVAKKNGERLPETLIYLTEICLLSELEGEQDEN